MSGRQSARPRVAASGVAVVIDAEENEPENFDKLNASYENAVILRRAGVLVAFKPSVARVEVRVHTPRFLAGRVARYVLPWHEALAAITINPVKAFGFDDRFGSIEPGKDADLVLWSGDPLETTSVATAVLIRGVEQPLTARNRQLRDRYLPQLRRRPIFNQGGGNSAMPPNVTDPSRIDLIVRREAANPCARAEKFALHRSEF